MARTRPCTRRHVDTCTRQYTCRVHGRVHVPYMAVYTSRVLGRVLAMYTAEDVRTDRPYTVVYTGGVDGPCARPVHGRVRAVYTARPLYGHVLAVFAGEDVFTGGVTAHYTLHGRVHGRVHDTLHGRVHGPYAAAQRLSTRPWTARTRTCNCRVDFPCTPYTWRCNVCVHVSPAHGPCTQTWTGRVYGCLHGPYVYTARTRR